MPTQCRGRTEPHAELMTALTQAELDWFSWLSITMEVQPTGAEGQQSHLLYARAVLVSLAWPQSGCWEIHVQEKQVWVVSACGGDGSHRERCFIHITRKGKSLWIYEQMQLDCPRHEQKCHCITHSIVGPTSQHLWAPQAAGTVSSFLFGEEREPE